MNTYPIGSARAKPLNSAPQSVTFKMKSLQFGDGYNLDIVDSSINREAKKGTIFYPVLKQSDFDLFVNFLSNQIATPFLMTLPGESTSIKVLVRGYRPSAFNGFYSLEFDYEQRF